MLLEESKLYHILSMSLTHVGLHIYISNHFRRLHRIKPQVKKNTKSSSLSPTA